MELRPYQVAAIAALRKVHDKRPILVMPCGAGKTTVASEIIRGALARENRAIFLVHRIELLDQALARLKAAGVPARPYAATREFEPGGFVYVGSISTVYRRLPDVPAARVVIVDECSHATSPSWRAVIGHYTKAGAFLIGLTATPYRLDGTGLGDVFGAIVQGVSARKLIELGYLIEPTVYGFRAPNLSGIRTTGGDYELGALGRRMKTLDGDVVRTWQEYAAGCKTIVFAVNIDHAKTLAERFVAAGYKFAVVSSETPAKERDELVQKLRDGWLDGIANCQIFTEGVDFPDLECISIARPTKSLALHVQMVGRVMRPFPGKEEAFVLDHAGNHERLGLAWDEPEFSLDGIPPRAPLASSGNRTCKECYAIYPAALSACPECGAAPPIDPLPEENGEAKAYKIESAEIRETVYSNMVRTAWENGYKLGYAMNQYRARYGSWPRGVDSLHKKLYPCTDHTWEIKHGQHGTFSRCSHCYARPSRGGVGSEDPAHGRGAF